MALARKSGKPAPAVVTPAPAAGVFLGTLRSEFDEPAALPATFASLLSDVESIIEAYRRGELDQRETAERLREQTLTDASGAQWMVGATTRRWYRRMPGGSWLATPPPAAGGEGLAAVAVLDESLLASMSGPRATNPLDLPSALYAAVAQDQAAARPGAVDPAIPVEPAEHLAEDAPQVADPVTSVLERDTDTAAARPAPASKDVAPVRVRDVREEPPAQSVPLPAGVTSTLPFELPDMHADEPPQEAAVEVPAAPVVPARHGISLDDLFSTAVGSGGGYGVEPAPYAARAAGDDANVAVDPYGEADPAGEETVSTHDDGAATSAPAAPEVDGDISAMLAELMSTNPVVDDGEHVEEIRPRRPAGESH